MVDEDNYSVYTMYYKNNINNGILDVTDNDFDSGTLIKLKKRKINYVCANLQLALMSLDDLKNDSRENLRSIDLYNYNDINTDYSFKQIASKLSRGLSKYKEIILWTAKNNTNSYLMPFYFINRFYNQIKDKEIYIVYIESLYGNDNITDLKESNLNKALETKIKLSREDISEYNKQWEQISKVKCDIRSYDGDKIYYRNIEDYFETILKYIPENSSIKRTKLIYKILSSDNCYINSSDIYSYIIDNMIEKNILISRNFNIPNFIPADDISINKHMIN